MTLRNSDGDKAVSAEVLADRELTHAVECAVASSGRPDLLAREIEQAFVRISQRVKAADMVPLSTSMFGAGAPNPGPGGVVMVVVMCNWIFKDNLEAMRRQQALMGGGPNGR